MRNYISET